MQPTKERIDYIISRALKLRTKSQVAVAIKYAKFTDARMVKLQKKIMAVINRPIGNCCGAVRQQIMDNYVSAALLLLEENYQ